MVAPWYVKLLVVIWLPSALAGLWFARQQELTDYLTSQQDYAYLDTTAVTAIWQDALVNHARSEGLVAYVISQEGCRCNAVAENHIQSLKQVPAMQVEWVTPDYFPIQAPAFPTLVVMSEGELVYFGAVGSGPMCINAGLENFLIQQNSQSRKQFWLNTVVKGCFCHR